MRRYVTLCVAALASVFANDEEIANFRNFQKNRSKTVKEDEWEAKRICLGTEPYTFAFGFTSQILQPSASNLHYGAEARPFPVPSPQWKVYTIQPDYHFGFDAFLTGEFHGEMTNMYAHWQHFQSSDSASSGFVAASEALETNMVGPLFDIGPDAASYKDVQGNVIFHLDEVALDYGINLHLGRHLRMNWFAGIDFLRLKQDLWSNALSPSGSIARSIRTPATFLGFGPELGTNFSYQLIEGFNFVGASSAALLVGTQKSQTIFKSISPSLPLDGVTSPNKQITDVNHSTQVIPALKGSLGLSYHWNYAKDYLLKVEAGYEAQIYLQAIQSIDMSTQVPTAELPMAIVDRTVGVYAQSFIQTVSNFTLAGPYVTVNFSF